IGTYDGKPLTTELSGNVIDVCPVGALTNKVFRFRARPWELIAKESIGYHDALGSNLFLHARRGDVMRAVPRDNEAVNECWLSDRDRYSHQGLYAEDRAVRPLIRVGNEGDDGDWREATWDEALAKAAKILRDNAADDLGILVHPATSNEEGALLARLADALGTGNLDHRIAQHDLSDGAVAEPFAMPIADIERADAIVIVGSHLRHEVPLLHQRVRKAWTRGAKVHIVNPVDFEFTFDIASKQIVAPSKLAEALASAELASALKDATRAVVILGAVAENGAHAAPIRAAASVFAQKHNAALCRIPQGANAIGLARHGVLPQTRGARDMLADSRGAYIVYGIEPGLDFAEQAEALKALGEAEVVAFSHFACRSTRRIADVILPIGALPEIDATLTNLDGHDQVVVPAGKLPGEARPGWRVLRALGGELGATGFEFTDLASLRASLDASSLLRKRESSAFANEDSKSLDSRRRGNDEQRHSMSEGLELAVSQAIYRIDGVTRRASALQAHPLTVGARVVLHADDAMALELSDGAMADVANAVGKAVLPVLISDKVAPGAAWIESGYGATAALGAGRVRVSGAGA
ncbi:MAG: molybdopterin-dependent oxidoreductase, partial [Luteimonas sp.]